MESHPQAVLKTVTFFIAEYGSVAWDKRGKGLRLAYWNADGVRGRKLELE
jgi:hypothetical protein